MIEKLYDIHETSHYKLVRKINEIIDDVNALADRLYEVTKEWDRLAGPENDVEYARQKVDERIAQIFGSEPVDFRLRY